LVVSELKEYAIRHVDVFTRKTFTGNPLMIVLNADTLGEKEMQAIAEEFGMPETTFILTPQKQEVDYAVRIFTPVKEVPFAGHPIVGTAHVAVTEGVVRTQKPRSVLSHETGVGILPIEVIYDNNDVPRIVMTQGKPQILAVPDREQIGSVAKSLGITIDDMMEPGLPPRIISTGLTQLFVPVKDLEIIKRVSPDLGKLRAVEEQLGLTGVGVFTTETVSSEASAHLRFFAPSIGIAEDAAAGSAAGGLGVYLAITHLLPESKLADICVEQGIEIRRPSLLYVSIQLKDGLPETVKVGGYCVTIASGTLRVP
jgi:trans-2,3-dihydro-3-hydroxyanthranilate isomerase